MGSRGVVLRPLVVPFVAVMDKSEATSVRAEPQPLPENFVSVQPGGGACYRIELAWGCLRRWWLVRFRPGYMRRMVALRRGDATGAPHAVIDPRDLKYCRNRCRCEWDPADDPFRWRDRLPFARWGLAELQLMGWPLLALTIALVETYWYLAIVTGALLCLIIYFFRDPLRAIPTEPGLLVAPADGKVVEITRLEYDEFVGGPAVRIGIFLSIFNVHLNRAPAESRVIALRYSPGKFLNALNPQSAVCNENTWIGLEEQLPPHRRMIVRQISGAIARRIVCSLRPGEVISRGQKFGMIKLGSRTELIITDGDDLTIEVKIGQRISAGTTVMARYCETSQSTPIPNP
jgi:phosphatidylserine decarboxylase